MSDDLNGRRVSRRSRILMLSCTVVVRYIKNQEANHARQTFKEEYLEFLKRFNVPYNPKYVFGSDDASEI